MFDAMIGDQVLESGDDLDALLERMLGWWELTVPGDGDIAVWFNEKSIAAVVISSEDGPQVHRFPMATVATSTTA